MLRQCTEPRVLLKFESKVLIGACIPAMISNGSESIETVAHVFCSAFLAAVASGRARPSSSYSAQGAAGLQRIRFKSNKAAASLQ
jgi:hypothetical protein